MSNTVCRWLHAECGQTMRYTHYYMTPIISTSASLHPILHKPYVRCLGHNINRISHDVPWETLTNNVCLSWENKNQILRALQTGLFVFYSLTFSSIIFILCKPFVMDLLLKLLGTTLCSLFEFFKVLSSQKTPLFVDMFLIAFPRITYTETLLCFHIIVLTAWVEYHPPQNAIFSKP